jgi:hypothetical protein
VRQGSRREPTADPKSLQGRLWDRETKGSGGPWWQGWGSYREARSSWERKH